jgi:Ca2+-transporting ATPase
MPSEEVRVMALVPLALDGKASIEQHLELDISDLKAVIAVAAQGPAKEEMLSEALLNLEYFFQIRIRKKHSRLDFDMCSRLCYSLLSVTGEYVEEGKWTLFRRKLSKNSILALKIFTGFLMDVLDFMHAVEDLDVAFLRKALRLKDHILYNSSVEERDIALELLRFFKDSVPKFKDWTSLVSPDYVDEVGALLNALPGREGQEVLSRLYSRIFAPKGQFYDVAPDVVLDMFETNISTGLSSSEAEARIDKYGRNRLPSKPPRGLHSIVIHQFADFIVLVLVASIAVSLAIQDWKAAGALSAVVLLNTVIGAIQEYKAEKALSGLNKFSISKAKVIRDCETVEIEAEYVVPGDIVVLEEGCQVPADLRLVEVAQLSIIEGLLTGESEPRPKAIDRILTNKLIPLGDRANLAFMNTIVSQGRGIGVAVNTGITTEVGKISAALNGNAKDNAVPISLLQKKLAALGKKLVALSIILCSLVVLIGWLQGLDDIVKIGISLAVSVIPEGLVVVVTLTLAIATQKMAKNRAIVRIPPVVETLGAVTSICSDKTGTLTMGKMLVSEIVTCSTRALFSTESDISAKGTIQIVSKDTKKLVEVNDEIRFVMLVGAYCNNSSVLFNDEEKQWESSGDPTEVALLWASRRISLDSSFWDKQGLKRMSEISFTAERKRMSVIASFPESYRLIQSLSSYFKVESKAILLCKGAVDVILPRCDGLLENGSVKAFDDASRVQIQSDADDLASRGMRVLGLAAKIISDSDALDMKEDDIKNVEHEMVFIGSVGIIDPPRPEVFGAIAKCRRASIRVCMITGDHRLTASSIAKSIGIYDPELNRDVLSGVQLAALSADDLCQFKEFPTVFARVNPDDKLKIVQALQKKGEIVGMTGDGVNDAPAIKCADVGIAMGIAGTEITRQAASVVLTDDNFATIVSSIEEGRRVFDNIQKFLVYLLSVNFSQVSLMMIAISIGYNPPFTAIMILWANIFVAVPPSLSLGMEPAENNIMERPPRDPKKNVLTLFEGFILLLHIFFLSGITLGVFVSSIEVGNDSDEYASSLAFMTLFTLHVVHSFMARSITSSVFVSGIRGNRYLVYGAFCSLFFILLAVYTPGINDFVELKPVQASDLWIVLVAIFAHVLLVEIVKVFARNVRRQSSQEELRNILVDKNSDSDPEQHQRMIELEAQGATK